MTKAEFLEILEKHLTGTATAAEQRLLNNFYRDHLAASKNEWTFTEKERIRMEVFESLNRAIDEEMREHRAARPARAWWVAASVALLLAAGLGFYLARIPPAEKQFLAFKTQRGEQKTVSLADGSTVRLNAESSITFPTQFESSETRSVILTGEAFFEVAPDKTKPFVIRSGDLVTTVVGTSFNVRAYPEDASIAVTVATGMVRIQAVDDLHKETHLLNPGEQGIYDKASVSIVKTPVNLENYLAWKDGVILLEGASLQEAADILSRWFNAEFIFENPNLKMCTIDGKFRNDDLENILENLRFLTGIEYRMEAGNRVMIDGKSCH